MNILDRIIIDKRREVILKKSIIPVSQLEASVLFGRKTISLSENLKNSNSDSGIGDIRNNIAWG